MALVALFFFVPSAVQASTLYDTGELSINAWHVHLSSHTFRAENQNRATLQITKNTPGSALKRGFLIFNQKMIPLKRFFNGTDVSFQKKIKLRRLNRLRVFLIGSPGASITIGIHADSANPPHIVNFSATPETIAAGATSTLTWSSDNADTCLIEPAIGVVDATGSVSVSPPETTTYTITVSGTGGTDTDTVTVTVYQPPTVSLSVSPQTIFFGEPATLSWFSANAETAIIDQDVGHVAPTGSTTVFPTKTRTFTITVSGPGGTASDQAQVVVQSVVAPLPDGSFGQQYEDLVPPDATIEAYDANRFSLITGMVLDAFDLPMKDVSVSIHNHLEYGTVTTDDQGRFTLPVEGGSTMTVVYQKPALITSHRQVYVPWNDIAIAETIRMIAEDSAATVVTFDGNPDTVVTHRSTPVGDEFGSRSATMVFTGDNRAWMVDEYGNDVQELSTITTRATEFATPESMPARLPPNSAYTYCAELSVDEAKRVRFDKPVVVWVENFLGFEVGGIVPVGYYDRDKGVWVPSDNGVVVRLLDTDSDGIVDALDSDGDDLPDDFDGNGSFSDEVIGLDDGAAYPPDATFWRASVTHFTPWDWNWPYGPPEDAISPNPESEPDIDQQIEDDCQGSNCSFVEERSRVFHEDIPIPGTDMTLHYASDRVSGYQTGIYIPASGDTIPASVNRIIVQADIAGRRFEQTLPPLSNQKAEFVWDGLDHLGRPAQGAFFFKFRIGFVYTAVYYRAIDDLFMAFMQTGAFDYKGGGGYSQIPTRKEVILWKRYQSRITRPSNEFGKGTIAEGWTLSSHHYVSPTDPTALHKGSGTVLRNRIDIIETVAGNGFDGFGVCDGGEFLLYSYSPETSESMESPDPPTATDSCADGGLATEASLSFPLDITVDDAGSLFIADTDNHRIRKVDINGTITTVAGDGTYGFSGDGGLATAASIASPYGVAVDNRGNLYIADTYNNRIRKVDTNGIITTVAGNGFSGFYGDNGLAIHAQLNNPRSIAVDDSCSLYIADSYNRRIRKVDPGGIITTVAGNGDKGYTGDMGMAVDASLSSPYGVAVDIDGHLYFSDSSNHCVRTVDNSGIIKTVAGNGDEGFSGDGGSATSASLNFPLGIAVDNEGNLFIADSKNNRIRKVDVNGTITTNAGTGARGFNGDGVSAISAAISQPYSVAVDNYGSLLLADRGNNRIRKASRPTIFKTATKAGETPFAEESGIGHLISSTGLHFTTIDLETGALLRQFSYDENDNLTAITDQFGNRTTINRYADGQPASITSPDGLTTRLTINDFNHLTHITYPDGSGYEFEYTDDGLLAAKIEPQGNRFEHQFDALGRLTDSNDDEGGHWQYSRAAYANGNILTEILTGEGNLTTYLDYNRSGRTITSTITDPTGAQTLFSQSGDGLTVNKSLPCGMDLDFEYDLDSQYKYKFVKKMSQRTPAGLERSTLRNKTYQDTDQDSIPDLIAETVTVNGRLASIENDTLRSQRTVTSPSGRTVTVNYDPGNLLTRSVSVPELFDTEYDYDGSGRLTSIMTHTRQTRFTYDGEGNLETYTDPQGFTTTYDYDSLGRVTAVFRPDTGDLAFSYDANGNMTILTNPSAISHEFGFNGVNLKESYLAPISGSYSYRYDADRRLIQTAFPSGKQIDSIYDATRLVQVQTPQGNIDYTYLCGNTIESIIKGTETVTYGYDGSLVTAETASGTLNQSLNWTYDNDFDLSGFTYAGQTIAYDYDNDGLLIKAGSFSIMRNVNNGMPEAITGGALSVDREFNGYGELDGLHVGVGGNSVLQWDLIRDDAGRITAKTETVAGITRTYEYSYDAMGRLETVTKAGGLVESYTYDLNGTRITEINTLRGITGSNFSYSDEDHLLTVGGTTYQYDLDGFLTRKTDGSEVSTYTYSLRGELLHVDLPDGRWVSYEHDPLGRRIAKRIDGTIVEKYLWQGLTRLLAVYDGSDNLVQRFEYADGRLPVAMAHGGNIYYLAYDQVGSLRVVTDASGNVVKRIDYDSFGNVLYDTNVAFLVPFGFAGGLADRDTGLVRFGYRDYDPDTGRWTAKDPIGIAGGDTDLYGYVQSNPVNLVDPLGLAWRQMRPLDLSGVKDTTSGPLHHDRFLYDNGDDSGYYGDSTVREDRASIDLQNKYQNVGEYLHDNILRQAEANLRSQWHFDKTAPETPSIFQYNLLFHNCQDYADAVMEEYRRLFDEWNQQNNPCP